MVKQIFSQENLSSTPWYRTRQGRMVLGVITAIAVVLIVLFNQQIGNFLNLIGSRAALDTGSASLQGTDSNSPGYFLDNSIDGYNAQVFNLVDGTWSDDLDSVKVENDRLMIN